MKWPWQHPTPDTGMTVGRVHEATRQVHAKAGGLQRVIAELDAAAELVRRNQGQLRLGAATVGDRRRYSPDPGYHGPERRRHA